MPNSIVNLLKRSDSLESSPQFTGYSKVIIHIDDESQVSAGDDTGRTLEIDNPFGTQQMANDILSRLQGYQYQPYTASGAMLDPAAEIGDGLSVGNIYGGIFQREVSFSRLMKANVSAPEDKEINHEFKFEDPVERRFSRAVGDVRASLIVQSNEIAAKVSQESNNESFGWSLLSDHWSVMANGQEVFRIDQNGGTFTGEVVASSGRIGGFTISASAIYNNISEFGGTQSSGVYIGTDGIQLGQGFKVDATGHLECNNATVSGTIRAGDIQYGGSNGYLNGNGIKAYTIDTPQLSSYVVGGVGGGVGYNKATNEYGGSYPTYFRANVVNAAKSLRIGGYRTLWGTINTGGHTYTVLMQGAQG